MTNGPCYCYPGYALMKVILETPTKPLDAATTVGHLLRRLLEPGTVELDQSGNFAKMLEEGAARLEVGNTSQGRDMASRMKDAAKVLHGRALAEANPPQKIPALRIPDPYFGPSTSRDPYF